MGRENVEGLFLTKNKQEMTHIIGETAQVSHEQMRSPVY